MSDMLKVSSSPHVRAKDTTDKIMLDVILALARQGKTMLIVTHEMQFAKAVADRIVFIDEGKIAEEGTAKEFFEHPRTERAKKFLHVFSFEDVR